MNRTEILRVAGDVLATRAGLRSTAATEARLESCLNQRAAARGLSLHHYMGRLACDADEVQALLDVLTVQETSFFRDPEHFDALARVLAPGQRQPIVVWSAGCATGQEPYSIAMALDEAGVKDWRVVATDVSRVAVERARQGLYRDGELRGLSAARRGRYLVHEDGRWRVTASLRERVTVHHHNLLEDAVPVAPGEATAIFCRNVLIYLRRDRIGPFLGRVREHLTTRGVLFLGGSESLWKVPDGYALERVGGAFAYRRIEGVAAAPPSVPPLVTKRPARSARPAPRRCAQPVAPETTTPVTDVEAYRRAAYLTPDDPLAHLQLGFSLEAEGDPRAGQRAFRAARAAIDRADLDDLEHRLEGYGVDALRAVLDAKLAEEDPCR